MTAKVTCSALAVKGCDEVFEGQSAEAVIRKVSDHLRSEHGVDLPDVDIILEGLKPGDAVARQPLDEAAMLIIRRLREELDLDPSDIPWHV